MNALVLACSDAGWLTEHGGAAEIVALPQLPGRQDVDPQLERLAGRRLVVHGNDAALAAVLQRLLRRSLLASTPVGFVPAQPSSAAAAVWGLPQEPARALRLALQGSPDRAALIRDDTGGVLVGLGLLRPVRGVIYCDDDLVLRGQASAVEVTPDPEAGPDTSKDGLVVRVRRTGLLGRRDTSTQGRAVQIGCLPTVVQRNGLPNEHPTDKWTWYRHTEDWRLVRGLL